MHIISQICISILINYYLTSFCNVCISRISILSLQHICLNKKVVHPQFKISKGGFQGDTFSSLLFLVAFQTIIGQYPIIHAMHGFSPALEMT